MVHAVGRGETSPGPLMWETVLSSALAVPSPTEMCITMVSGIVSFQSGNSVNVRSGNNMLKCKTSNLRLGVVAHI